jgi:AcrR family transcriptional regulator
MYIHMNVHIMNKYSIHESIFRRLKGGLVMDANGQDPGRLSRRERTRQQHRDEIVSAATDLFARHGYEGTSMQMIADQAEISVGKLYLHFEGKEDMYRSVVEFHAGAIRERADMAVDPSMSPIDRIRARTVAVLDYMDEHDEFVRFYVGEMEGSGKGCCRKGESGHEVQMREFAVLLREAIDNGDIPDEDPEMIAAMIHGAGHSLMALVIERGDVPCSKVAEYVDRMILRPLEDRKREEKRKEGGG